MNGFLLSTLVFIVLAVAVASSDKLPVMLVDTAKYKQLSGELSAAKAALAEAQQAKAQVSRQGAPPANWLWNRKPGPLERGVYDSQRKVAAPPVIN